MAKKVNHILETYDYDKFKMIKGNRNIKKNSNLENSVKKNGIILPVDVNEYGSIGWPTSFRNCQKI